MSNLIRNFSLPLPLFQNDSAWNQKIVGIPSVPDNKEQVKVTHQMLKDYGIPTMLVSAWEFEYSVPIFQVDLTGERPQVMDVPICPYDEPPWEPQNLNHGEPSNLTYSKVEEAGQSWFIVHNVPVPDGPVRPAGPQHVEADGHLVLYHPIEVAEYDFYNATTARQPGQEQTKCKSLGGGREGTTILETGSMAYFKLKGPGAQGPADFPIDSSRASGVPLLAGLLVPEDLADGVDSTISHALGFILPRVRYTPNPSPAEPNYVYPASKSETDDIYPYPAIAMGQRLRLKPTIVNRRGTKINEDRSRVAPITRIFLKALREYGTYLVDRGPAFNFFAEDGHTARLDLSEEQVRELIGGARLDASRTKWENLMDKLYEQLSWEVGNEDGNGGIPFAAESNGETYFNFEVVEPAQRPKPLPLSDA